MAEHVIRLPDVGEGVAEAELVEWRVKIGEQISEDAILGAVMTDKATVEIPSPVGGEVVWLGGEVGDVIAVGSELVRLKVAGEADRAATDEVRTVSTASAPIARSAVRGGDAEEQVRRTSALEGVTARATPPS